MGPAPGSFLCDEACNARAATVTRYMTSLGMRQRGRATDQTAKHEQPSAPQNDLRSATGIGRSHAMWRWP